MYFTLYIPQMAIQASRIEALVAGVTNEQARWKPDPDSWSILEVINHLYDEEQFDFRVRLDILLHTPEKPWPPINPQGWVTERRYNERDISESLANFLREREKSLEWLKGLGEPNLDTFIENQLGRMSAGDMFASWLAHDLLHTRQLVELQYAYTKEKLASYDPGYAGDW